MNRKMQELIETLRTLEALCELAAMKLEGTDSGKVTTKELVDALRHEAVGARVLLRTVAQEQSQ